MDRIYILGVGMSKKKYKQVKVNLDENVHQQFKEFCDAGNITMAEYFRKSINTKIDDVREPLKTRVYKVVNPELLYHLNKIGNNLNQVARHLNEGNTLDLQVLAELINIEKTLKEFL